MAGRTTAITLQQRYDRYFGVCMAVAGYQVQGHPPMQ
jgi:hypothetical protein